MVELGEFKDKQLKYFWYIVLYVSLFAIIFFVFYGLKTINGEQCSDYTTNNKVTLVNYNVTTSDSYSFPVYVKKSKNNNIVGSDVCLDIKASNSTYLTVTMSSTERYVNNFTSGYTCFEDVERDNNGYLTLTCSNCDNNDYLIIKSGNDEAIINHINLFSNNNAHYLFINKEHCKEIYKTFVLYYFLLLGLFVGIMLIIRGLRWFGSWVFRGIR